MPPVDPIPLFTPQYSFQATIKQLTAKNKALTRENGAIRKASATHQRRIDELERKQRRSLKVFNALTSIAAMFSDYFIDKSGDTDLAAHGEKYWELPDQRPYLK